MLALSLAAMLLGAVGDPAGGAPGPRWFGIAFGSAAVTYRDQLGDPLLVTGSAETPERRARFWLAAGASTYLVVTERRGAVVGVEALTEGSPHARLLAVEPDPSGIALGSTLEDVAARRSRAVRRTDAQGATHLIETVDAGRRLVADYRFTGGRLVADAWSVAGSAAELLLPGAAQYAEPVGTDETTAILDAQSNERDGQTFERLYLRAHPCASGAAWSTTARATRSVRERWYDVISVTCPATGERRDFTFDVTPFSGTGSVPRSAAATVPAAVAAGTAAPAAPRA